MEHNNNQPGITAVPVVGNRISLSKLDVAKIALKYDCNDASKLCTHRVSDPCTTTEDCACHLHELYDEAPISFKVQEVNKLGQLCWACREQCPLYGQLGGCSTNPKCICADEGIYSKIALSESSTDGHEGELCYVCGDLEDVRSKLEAQQNGASLMQHTGFFIAMTANPSLQRQEFKCLPKNSDEDKDRVATRCCQDSNKKVSMKYYGGCSAIAAFRSARGSRICKGCEAMRYMTHDQAANHCESHGLRLCTKQEVSSCKTCETGCFFDELLIWTSTPCDPRHAEQKVNPNAQPTKSLMRHDRDRATETVVL